MFELDINPTISNVIALASFILVCIQMYLRHRERKRNVVFCLKNITKLPRNELDPSCDYYILRYRIDNLAPNQIGFTNFQLIIDNECYSTFFISIFAEKYVYQEETQYIKLTDVVPVNLGAYDSHGGYLAFRLPANIQLNSASNLTMIISTSRGKPKKIQPKLNENIHFR